MYNIYIYAAYTRISVSIKLFPCHLLLQNWIWPDSKPASQMIAGNHWCFLFPTVNTNGLVGKPTGNVCCFSDSKNGGFP